MKGFSSHYVKCESCYDSSSDHTPVLLTLSTEIIEHESPERLYNSKTDWNSFKEYIDENIKLNVALKTPDEIENATKYITNLIQVACWRSTPRLDPKKRINNYPLEIRKAVLERRRLRRVWQLSRLASDKTDFNRQASRLKEILQTWHNKTLETQLESLTPSAATDYSLWKFTKSYDRPQLAKPPLRNNNGWARTSQDKANLFADHLSNVFSPNNTSDTESEIEVESILAQPMHMSLPPAPVTVREVWRTIIGLKDKKAPGHDLITKEILRELPRKAIVFLTMLYNGILRVQYFLDLWKVSQIIMIHKAGKPANQITSYRPISLLPILSKVCEKLIFHRIMPLLEKNNTIPNHQFGFRQQHSTIEQVHRVVEKIRKSLEEKEYCSSAFLDIQQAFDRVWHEGLLCKIRTSLPHSYYILLKSYLTGRIFQVKESESHSKFYNIRAGVPQGSVLGPTLYTLYTSDLPQVDGVMTATYADDTAIMASNKQPELATEQLQQGLDAITEWLQKWKIKASTTKSVQVTFTLRRENCPPVCLENSTLPHKDSVRYLGIHLDRRLTWNKHIKSKREELNIRHKKLYWMLCRNSKLSIDNKLLIYKSILKPTWMYGIQLWGSASNSNIAILQRMQSAILRTLAHVPWLVTNSEIHAHLNMTTVKEEIQASSKKYQNRLEKHPNVLAASLTTRSYPKRLKRKDIL